MHRFFSDMTPTERLELARGMREVLRDESCWTQDYYVTPHHSLPDKHCFCLIGAGVLTLGKMLDEEVSADNDADIFTTLHGTVQELLRGFAGHQFTVVSWNDAGDRTWADVDALLNKLVAHYEAEALQAALRAAT